jgi:hypothetical protein
VHAQVRAEHRAAAGHEHATAAGHGSPLGQELLVLAVIEHQQPRHGAIPGRAYHGELRGEIGRGLGRPQAEMSRPAAQCDLSGHGCGVGKAQPEHPAGEELAVAVYEFGRELRLSHAAHARHRGHLADRGRVVHLQRLGQLAQIVHATDEQRIPRHGHARARRQRGGGGDAVARQRRQRIRVELDHCRGLLAGDAPGQAPHALRVLAAVTEVDGPPALQEAWQLGRA